MAQYKLTYFDIKGVAEPIRLIFALADIPYEDIRIPHNPNPVGGPANRFSPEIKHKLPYGQVPILEFGENILLSQSATIARFLARKFNLLGSDDVDAAKIDEIIDACKDYTGHFKWRPWRPVKDEEEKTAAIKILADTTTPKYLGKFTNILKQNGGTVLVGKSLTWADLMLYHVLTYFGQFVGFDLVKDYPNLQAFINNIESNPRIKEWLKKRPETAW